MEISHLAKTVVAPDLRLPSYQGLRAAKEPELSTLCSFTPPIPTPGKSRVG